GLFSAELRERIRAANDIVDVIGSYVPLKRAGANFQALCPFHKEKTPSFNVNPGLQIFKCFGCHKGGDVFTFLMEYETLEFPEAVKRLAERAKIPIEYEAAGGEGQSRHVKDSLLEIHEQITQRWQAALANEASGQIARDYLARRGVSSDAIRLFRLGYAPELWDDTVNWSRNKGYAADLVEKAGLILRKETGTEGAARYYDRFRGRLMFPICDEQGRVVGFSGRVLSGDEKTAKYVNSPETPIFTKSKVFFGLDKSKRALLDADCAILCEGQLDLIACFMAGVENIVAPQGTAFTAEHARILKRYVNEVVICFDADEAGQNAAVRSLDHLLASGLAARVVTLPAPHDPDSFVRAFGGEAFKERVQKAEGFFDWYLNRLCSTNDPRSDKGRLQILAAMAEAIHKTDNAVLIEKYAQKTGMRLGVTPDSVRAEFRKIGRGKFRAPPQTAEQPPPAGEPLQPPSPQEYWLLKLLFLNEDLVPWAAAHLDLKWVKHPLVNAAVSRRLCARSQETWTSLAAFLDECDSPSLRDLIAGATVSERPLPQAAQQLADVVQRLRNQHIDAELAAIIAKANQPEIPESEREALLRQHQELRLAKQAPIKPG
ncbi:MAG TPA: DNA primase, partial [Verrucomicrobiae bacterium]|nr:DNA primase [Verrucomicrobiae bacterium]